MRIIKNTKGITLISLVITIIILIILASVATYSGIQVVNSSKLAAFTTELKIMQTQVNKLYDERTNDEETIDGLGKGISTVQTQANKVFAAIADEIDNNEGYRYYDKETIKNLGIEGVEGEFFVNVQKRSVVSYEGLKYEGNTYYTLNQLPDNSLYNVEYQASQEQPNFDVDYDYLENGRYKITVNNINYNGNINNWQVKYKKEEEQDWKTTNNYSFIINEVGNYRVKIANNNTESREKQIMAKSLFLPSEYQEVEYIESTGTQYIDIIYNNSNDSINTYYYKYLHRTSTKQSSTIMGNRTLIGNERFGQIWFRMDQKTAMSIGGDLSASSKFYVETELNKINEVTCQIDNNNKKYTILFNDYKKENISFNGESKAQTGFQIFAGDSSQQSSIVLFNIKIYNQDKMLFNFIPCYRKSDVKPGLYDLVNNVFYTNQGTGDFIKGKDIDSGETIKQIIINNL